MGKDISIEILKYLDFNDGFYFECGANDGIFQSNTFRLEKEKNWSGILVEPSPFAFQQCMNNRDKSKNVFLNYALVSDDYKYPTITGDFDGHPMSSINGKRRNNFFNANIEVPVTTFTNILLALKVNKIDFLSLDVEGFELEVLRGLDFTLCSPTYILLEVNTGEEEVFGFLKNKKYKCLCCLSDFNKIDDPTWPGTHNDYLFKFE